MIEYENLRKSNYSFFNDYRKKFEEILNSGWYILGNNVTDFENQFAGYLGAKHAIGVASGLDALSLSLRSLSISSNSEIIVPSNTYIATILSIINNGLKPVLVEPDIRTYNIDPDKIQEKITSATKAIMIVHLYGKCCCMDKIMDLASLYKLYVIEDCAQSHGAKFKDKLSGTFGDLGAHSFYPTKNLGALGDAGAITTGNSMLAEQIRALRNYGSRVKYVNEYIGFNSRLDEIQAGFLSVKLRSLDKINEHKRSLAKLYLDHLKEHVIKPVVSKDFFDVYHIFNIRHRKRDKLREFLLNKGIKTDIHYPIPPHRQKAMIGLFEGDYPVSEEIHSTTLSLPISYFHTSDDIMKVIESVNSFK